MLLQELMSCWTECAPGQLAAGPELTAVQCMEGTLQCVGMLLHQLPSLFPTGKPVFPSVQALHTAFTGSPNLTAANVWQNSIAYLSVATASDPETAVYSIQVCLLPW